MDNLTLFIGRFHPLVVHLPIGFLMLAFLMTIYQQWKHNIDFSKAISFSLMLSTVTGVIACILGYFLSLEGGYATEALNLHMYMGIGMTVLSAICFALTTKPLQGRLPSLVFTGLFVLLIGTMSFTGHLGGNMTHGEDYLTEYLPFQEKEIIPQVTSMEEVVLYTHVVANILDQKCLSCHNESKKKGGLSLATIADIETGGDHGSVTYTNADEKNELIRRILLPEDNEDVMPPKGKSPLSKEEIEILSWWIDHGASFDQRLSQEDTTQKSIISDVAHYLGLSEDGTSSTGEKLMIDSVALTVASNNGFVVRELTSGSGKLDIVLRPSAIKSDTNLNSKLSLLDPLKENIVWLKLSAVALTDDHMPWFDNMKGLERLMLDQNRLTDAGISQLKVLPQLKMLNLYGNEAITNNSIKHLATFPKLDRVYLWKTSVTSQVSSLRLPNNLEINLGHNIYH